MKYFEPIVTVFVPVSFYERDCRPSETGNYYNTITIRGIFSSSKKATEAMEDWYPEGDYRMLFTLRVPLPDLKLIRKLRFDIDYEFGDFSVNIAEYGDYGLNIIVNEDYSCVWDKDGTLGTDNY